MRQQIIHQLKNNARVIQYQLDGMPEGLKTWKKDEHTWCLLEIICHLYDEEREDFRQRIGHILNTPNETMLKFDPTAWVTEREYMKQNLGSKLKAFLAEREYSISWLQDNLSKSWDNIYHHDKMGDLTADYYLSNWLAHDCIHIRQINRTIYNYYASLTSESLDYAGNW